MGHQALTKFYIGVGWNLTVRHGLSLKIWHFVLTLFSAKKKLLVIICFVPVCYTKSGTHQGLIIIKIRNEAKHRYVLQKRWLNRGSST